MTGEQKWHIGRDGKPHACTAASADSCPLKTIAGHEKHYSSLAEATKAAEGMAASTAAGKASAKLTKTNARPAKPVAASTKTTAIKTTTATAVRASDVNKYDYKTIRRQENAAKILERTNEIIDDLAAHNTAQDMLSASHDMVEDAAGVKRGKMGGTGDYAYGKHYSTAQHRFDNFPEGTFRPSTMFRDGWGTTTRSYARIVLNAQMTALIEDGWRPPTMSQVDDEQSRIWRSVSPVDKTGISKRAVRGLAILQAGYDYGGDGEIGVYGDPTSMLHQALAYERYSKGIRDDGTAQGEAMATADADAAMRKTEISGPGAGVGNYHYNLSADGRAMWRVGMLLKAQADGLDLNDEKQFNKLEPEATMGATESIVKKMGKNLPQEARRELGL